MRPSGMTLSTFFPVHFPLFSVHGLCALVHCSDNILRLSVVCLLPFWYSILHSSVYVLARTAARIFCFLARLQLDRC